MARGNRADVAGGYQGKGRGRSKARGSGKVKHGRQRANRALKWTPGTLLIAVGVVVLLIAGGQALLTQESPATIDRAITSSLTQRMVDRSTTGPAESGTFAQAGERTPAAEAQVLIQDMGQGETESQITRASAITRIRLPRAGIDTAVVEVGSEVMTISGRQVLQWQVADYAAGHHDTSAQPGQGGNIVIAGHSDWRGEVFRNLEHAEIGDTVILTTEDQRDISYVVTEMHYRKELGAPIEERLATGTFIAPMDEERVTLVTCWPYGIDDHRLIVIAKPLPVIEE